MATSQVATPFTMAQAPIVRAVYAGIPPLAQVSKARGRQGVERARFSYNNLC